MNGHQKKPLMPEPKRTGQHQEPVQGKLGTKAVIEPTLYLWRVQFIYYKRTTASPL